MPDPFLDPLKRLELLELLNSALSPIFSVAIKRDENYIHKSVQQLSESLTKFKEQQSKYHFTHLAQAINSVLQDVSSPLIDANEIIALMNKLAGQYAVVSIDWSKPQAMLIGESNGELLDWIREISNQGSNPLSGEELTKTLISCRDTPGFSQKLSLHLKENPNFLSALIQSSEDNFINITNTRLILYLTDVQLATAIVKLMPSDENPSDELVEKTVKAFNERLSNGHSIPTLLRNADAKKILDESPIFRRYQSEEYHRGLHTRAFQSVKEQLVSIIRNDGNDPSSPTTTATKSS